MYKILVVDHSHGSGLIDAQGFMEDNYLYWPLQEFERAVLLCCWPWKTTLPIRISGDTRPAAANLMSTRLVLESAAHLLVGPLSSSLLRGFTILVESGLSTSLSG